MSSESRDLPEQEHSIKARGKELFVERLKPENSQPAKPFRVYLRETPAQPISTFTKVVLWIVGIVVAVLLLAALWRVSHRYGPGRRASKSPRPAAKTAMIGSPVDTPAPGREIVDDLPVDASPTSLMLQS